MVSTALSRRPIGWTLAGVGVATVAALVYLDVPWSAIWRSTGDRFAFAIGSTWRVAEVVAEEMAPELRDKFKQAFLALDASVPEHAAVLELQGAAKFVPADASDFDTLEQVARGVGLLTN